MSYAAYLSEKFGICEDRILHRQPGFFKGVSDGMKGAPNALARQRYAKIKHDMEGKEATSLDSEVDDRIKTHQKNVDKAIDKATKEVLAAAAKKKQTAEKQAAADWLASQGLKAGRASKGSGAISGQKSSRSGGVFSTELMKGGTRTKGAQAALDHFRNNPKSGFDNKDKGLTSADGQSYGITAKFKKDGKDIEGVKRQVFPKEYKDNPKFKGGRFAGDKDADGKELKAGDQYVAEALDIIIEAINQGNTDNDALELAKQYLCEEYGYGAWSARRVLNEVLSGWVDDDESA